MSWCLAGESDVLCGCRSDVTDEPGHQPPHWPHQAFILPLTPATAVLVAGGSCLLLLWVLFCRGLMVRCYICGLGITLPVVWCPVCLVRWKEFGCIEPSHRSSASLRNFAAPAPALVFKCRKAKLWLLCLCQTGTVCDATQNV